MAVTPYRVISWQPRELITDAKLDQFASNQQWLYDHMPRARYTFTDGARRNEGVKIVGGHALIRPNRTGREHRAVYFGEFFTIGCKPIVTATPITGQRRMFCTVDGIGTMLPDHRGFEVHVEVDAKNVKNNVIKRNMYVGWHAIGY